MLHRTKSLFGKKLSALDGQIGHVRDFYFDDESWAVRYLVADTGPWLAGRRVLLSPHALGLVTDEVVKVNLTRDQIEKSPPVDTHKPVSRRYEEEYYRYYGWPVYWDGGQIWGMGAVPIAVPLQPLPAPAAAENASRDEDRHLRSVKAVVGYEAEAADGALGSVKDFVVDFQSWEIRQLVIDARHWFAHHEIVVTTAKVARISYEEAKLFVGVTKATLTAAQEYLEPAVRADRS